MGMTLRNPSQEDFNQLKKMLADGIITPQQLQTMPMDVGYDGPPEKLDQGSQNMLAQMMQSQAMQQSPQATQGGGYVQMDGGPQRQIGQSNGPSPQQLSDQASISQNADGVALSKLTAGGGYQGLKSGQGLIRMTQPDGSTEDRYINSAPSQTSPMKLYGFGNGSLTSLGNADAGAVADVSRNMVEVPGLGKGYYSKDGKSAIISNPDGSKTQVLLGYDREASQAMDDRNMQRQKMRGDIAQNEAQTAFTQAKTDELLRPGSPDAVKPTFDKELGAYVYPPDEKNPNGRLVPLEGIATKDAKTKLADANDVLSIVKMATPLLDKSTGSTLGNLADAGAQLFGVSTEGANAAAQLKALSGALVSKMPKMSGPQSDKDVMLYKEMAGNIGDPTIPAERKKAALEVVQQLNEKYIQNIEAKAKPNLIRSPETSSALAEAKQKISQGWPKDEVIKRLRAAGINETP